MSKLEKLGALWIKKSGKGVDYMSGQFGQQKVVVFKVRNKRQGGPDFEVFKSEPMEKRETTNEVPW